MQRKSVWAGLCAAVLAGVGVVAASNPATAGTAIKTTTVQWGQAGDVPVAANYGGDARRELAVWRPSNGTWLIRGVGNYQWGVKTDLPAAADFTGDGKADIAVFRPSNGTWYLRGGSTIRWGQAGDVPVAADYTGDGKSDIAVFRPSNGSPWGVLGRFSQHTPAPTSLSTYPQVRARLPSTAINIHLMGTTSRCTSTSDSELARPDVERRHRDI